MAVIDLCSNGVTKTYVQSKINEAVFKAGTCTPESVQAQIDAANEIVNVNTATAEKLIEVYNNPAKYIVTYTIDDITYISCGYCKNDTLLVNMERFIVENDYGEYIRDHRRSIKIASDGTYSDGSIFYLPYIYRLKSMDDNQIKALPSRITQGCNCLFVWGYNNNVFVGQVYNVLVHNKIVGTCNYIDGETAHTLYQQITINDDGTLTYGDVIDKY